MPSGEPNQARSQRLTVFRSDKSAGGIARYSRILNDALQNDALSFKARGILAYVLSMPPHWRHSAGRLSERSREGKDAIQAGLRELAENGYLQTKRERTPAGTIKTTLIFSEEPRREKPSPGEPTPGQPGSGEPIPGQPGSGEPIPGEPRSFETTVRNNDEETTIGETTLSLGEGECAQIREAWNAICAQPRRDGSPGRPRWERVTPMQRAGIETIIRGGRTLEDFERVFRFIWGDDFHNGQGPRTEWPGATPGWLLKDDNFQEVWEKADHRERAEGEGSRPADEKF